MSPFNLKTTTVADELKMATNGQSKVVSLAFKDRAAILMAGHSADDVVWFDNTTGNWVTSTWYAPNKQLPKWAAAINSSRSIDKAFGTKWEPLLPDATYSIARRSPASKAPENGKPFSYTLGTPGGTPDNKFYSGLWTSHVANEFTVDTAIEAVKAEKLGKHSVPDMLIIGFSSNDTIGHAFGPNSPEVMDITIRHDRQLSKLFNALDKEVGIENVVIGLSADHGVVPIPEEASKTYQIPVERPKGNDLIQKALAAKFGEGKWVLDAGQEVYLNRALAAEKKISMETLEKAAAEAAMTDPSTVLALTRTQILSGNVPKVDFSERIFNGFNAAMGGDLVVLSRPGYYFGSGTGTGHGSIWNYDAHVPILLRGPGITKGVFSRSVCTSDIAPTLAYLLGIESPSGTLGHPLVEALGGK